MKKSDQITQVHIRGGRLVDPSSGINRVGDLFIAHGKIASIDSPPVGFVAERTLDARNLVICPGLVDLDAHLREPGSEYKATLESELAAAVAGGITSLACPPDTDPVLDEPGLVEMVKHRSRQLYLSKVYPVGALTQGLAGQQLTEMAELAEAGCVAFGQAGRGVADTRVLLRALQYAATFDLAVWLQPCEHFLSRQTYAHQGITAQRLGLSGVPDVAEVLEVHRLLLLAQEAGARLHLSHLTSARSVEMVRRARQSGIPVSCDVGLLHLHRSDGDLADYDTMLRVDPVLRTQHDQQSLRLAVAEGVVEAISSQHLPVDAENKRLPFAEAEVGVSALELLLPLTLAWGRDLNLDLPATLAPITSAPAKILGLPCGLIAGNPADLCVFHPQETYTLTPEFLKSQGKNTPFMGETLKGKVLYTLVDGQMAYSIGKEE